MAYNKKLLPEDKREKVEHNMRVARLPIIDTYDYKQVQKRINEYFEVCAADGCFATVAGLALSLGVTRQSVFYWLNGKVKRPPEVINAIEWGMAIINAQTEEAMMDGSGNVVGQIFLTKNNFPDYKDEREVTVQQTQKELTAEQLMKMAAKLPGFERPAIEQK